MGALDYLLLGVLLVLAALALWYGLRHRDGCSGGCAGCGKNCSYRREVEKDPAALSQDSSKNRKETTYGK